MLQLSPIEFFCRALPESFILMFYIFILSKKEIHFKKYILSSGLLAISYILIRSLPINYGVHTILAIIMIFIINRWINKIDIIRSIKAAIITIIIQFICEGINVVIIDKIFNISINTAFENPVNKVLLGIPSLVIFASIAGILFYINKRKRY